MAVAAMLFLPLSDAFCQHPGLASVASQRRSRSGISRVTARFFRDERFPTPACATNDNARTVESHVLERRDALFLLAAGSAASLIAPKEVVAAASQAPVVVIGAAGLTGGETVRAVLRTKLPVVASTRRPVTIVSRDKLVPGTIMSKDTLVLDSANDAKQTKCLIADALLPETLSAALDGARAVIYCAGARPKVEATITPGTNPGAANKAPAAPIEKQDAKLSSASYLQSNMVDAALDTDRQKGNVEDAGLVNVAKECLRLGIPKLVIVSSVCAKCQGKESDAGEQVDKGTASCDTCYRKQAGERTVRDLYAAAPKGLTYTIVRPGLLSNGEPRGASSVELNQGVSKSGIISRSDLAQLLVTAAVDDGAAGKTFEVYYADTAQPVDMYASLRGCKEAGKSVKECFFGKGFDEKSPINLDDVLKRPLQGSLFATGSEVQGSSYSQMLARLQSDAQEPFDLNSLASPSIM